MILSYLKTALRNMLRYKVTTMMSIIGLSLGMCYTLLIFLYVQYEMSYDSFHSKRDVIYQIVIQRTAKDKQPDYSPLVPYTLSEILEEVYLKQGFEKKLHPERPPLESDHYHKTIRFEKTYPQLNLAEQPGHKFLTDTVRMLPMSGSIDSGNTSGEENHLYFTEPQIFRIFNFELERGNPKTALAEPGSIILTPQMAEKYFPSEDPVGKKILFSPKAAPPIPLKVTGILHPIPPNSSINVRFLAYLPYNKLQKRLVLASPLATYTYIEFGGVRRERQPSILETILTDLVIWYRPIHVAPVAKNFQQDLSSIRVEHHPEKKSAGDYRYTLQSLKESYFATEKYFGSDSENHKSNHNRGHRLSLVLLFCLSLLVLVISCINVINLFTSRSAGRAKEIAIRKVLGADRSNLVFQFLTESTLVSFISLLLALSLIELLLPGFNRIVERSLSVDYFGNWGYLSAIAAIVLLTGIFSGIYPAIFLSSFSVIDSIKGSYPLIANSFRASLVICQITASVYILNYTIYHSMEFQLPQSSKSALILDNAKNHLTGSLTQSSVNNDVDEKDVTSINSKYPWTKTLKIASVVSICLVVLGIMGFAQYEAERKTKGIGIRKALGASRMQLCSGFIIKFIPHIITANILACLLSLITIPRFLQMSGLPSPSHIGLPVFLYSGTLTVVIYLMTVSIQIYKAASTPPAAALRDE